MLLDVEPTQSSFSHVSLYPSPSSECWTLWGPCTDSHTRVSFPSWQAQQPRWGDCVPGQVRSLILTLATRNTGSVQYRPESTETQRVAPLPGLGSPTALYTLPGPRTPTSSDKEGMEAEGTPNSLWVCSPLSEKLQDTSSYAAQMLRTIPVHRVK